MTYSEGYTNDTTDTSSESNQTQTEYSTQYTTSEVESVESSDDVVVSDSNNSNQYLNTRMGEIEPDDNGFILTASSRSVGVASTTGYNVDVNLSGREETLITGAIDNYECQLEYGLTDTEAIGQLLIASGNMGVREYNERYVNTDRLTGEKKAQFTIDGEPQECVNILTPGGWDYIDYTAFENFQGDLGNFVVPLRTTPFGPPTQRANYEYSNARTNKGVTPAGVILGDKEVDFNLILDESHWTTIDELQNMIINDIDEDTEWQSGPRIDSNSGGCDRHLAATPACTSAGSEMTPGVSINDLYSLDTKPGANYGPGGASKEDKDKSFEYYANRNCEQTWKCTSPKSDYDVSARQLIYVSHSRSDESDTTADFGVMGVSGWLYGLNTIASVKLEGEFEGYTPEYPHGGAAINYVYGVYKKDKSDEELEELEENLNDYVKYVQDLYEAFKQEEENNNQQNAGYANEPNSEYRTQPQYLYSFVENGLLDRMAEAVLQNNESNHFLLQLTCEFLCARLPCNEGKSPHEYEFPFTHDRLCTQLAADGRITMEVVLDYLFAVYNNVPDSIMQSIGYIPRVRDIANFTHHEIFPEDPGYFRHFLYSFVLWACRPSAPKKIQSLSFDVLPATGLFADVPMPVIWWEDGTYLTYSEWLNYETGGWETECFRNEGKPIVSPRVITLQDGSEAYNELICWDDETEEIHSVRTEHCLMALSGPAALMTDNDEDRYDDLENVPNRFYDMLRFRKKILRGFLKSWSNVTEYSMNYEIPDEFADLENPNRELFKGRKLGSRFASQRYVNPDVRFGPNDGEEVYNWNAIYAREEDWKYYSRWIPPSPPSVATDGAMLCFYQDSLGGEPQWDWPNVHPDALDMGTYDFEEYVHKSKIPPEGNAPHGDKEMITIYVFVSHNDLVDEVKNDPDARKQKPDFTFWWGKSKGGQSGKNWATGGAYIKLESPRLLASGEKDPQHNKTKTYKFSVPSGSKDNTRKTRFFRIGAYFFKGTSMVNDKKVMGEKSDWLYGKYFHLEIRPAKKNEKDPTKNSNKGPVYHADSAGASTGGVSDIFQPKWYDTYWKNPRNFVKDGARALDVNQWYTVRWNTSYTEGKAIIPNLRFWWGRDDETQNPIDIPLEQRDGAFQGNAQFLFGDDEESYYFKPLTKYLYFGGFDSGRDMDQWSKDGEPWVTVNKYTDPIRTGPAYFANSTEAFSSGDFDISNVHWEQEFTFLSRDSLPYELTIPLYVKRGNITAPPSDSNYLAVVNPPTRVAGASGDGMKATRVWRFKKNTTSSTRNSHLFQFGYNAFSGYAYLMTKDMSNKYSIKSTLQSGTTGASRYTGFHTATPRIPHNAPENRGYRIHDSNSSINWGVYDVKDSTTATSGNVKKKRTLKNWSRLGEAEQLTCMPAMEESGPFYWALHGHNQPYMTQTLNSALGNYQEPGWFAEAENYYDFLVSMGTKQGAVNIYHTHWPGYEAQRFMPGGDRFNEIAFALNSRFDSTKPEGPNNKKEVPIKKGKKYKLTFPTQEKGLEIMDAQWTYQHKMAGSEGVINHKKSNLKYNMPMNMKWKVNWKISSPGAGWNMGPDSHMNSREHNLMSQADRNIEVEPIEMTYGETYKVTAKGDTFIFGVYDFSGWRVSDLNIGQNTFQNGDVFSETNVTMNGFTNNYRSMFNWSPYGIEFPFKIETAEFDQGPEIWANGNSVVNETIEAYDKTDMGEINFAFKTKTSTPVQKGDYWETPFNVWTPGKNDHDFWDDLYGTGDVQATKIKKGYMYKVEFVKSNSKEQPWSSTFCFLTDDLVKDRDKAIQRMHYPTSKDGFDPDTKLVKRAFKGGESRYFPDKGGYAKTADGEVIRMEHSLNSPTDNSVLILATTNNLLMGAHNPNQLVDMESQVEGVPLGFKDENNWNKKGDQTHFKITQTKLEFWKDGYAYWAAKDHDDKGQANFFSKHWNLPLKHVAPGFIVQGDEYEIAADTNMSPTEVYHIWWAPAEVENHFAASDEVTQNFLRNALVKDAQTITKGTTVRVTAKGDRLLLAATNTGVLREDLWPKDAKGAPVKIRRMPGEKDPFGPGYYGTKKDTNDNRYGLDNVYWKEIWDWNSWLSYQESVLARALDRFKRGRTYRIQRRDTDYSNMPSVGKPLAVKYDYEVIAAKDPEALTPGLHNSMNFELLGELTSKNHYIDVKSMANAEVVFITINTPNNRDVTNWGREGETVYVDVIDKGDNYESGPGYWGKKNGAQFLKPDFCNEHFLSPLNHDKVKKGVAYQVRRSKLDAPGVTGTYKLYNCKVDDLIKQHEQNARFTDIDVELPPWQTSTAARPFQYFIPDEGDAIIYGVYGKQGKTKITDWSIDGEEIDVEMKKVDVDTERGPLYWANHRVGDPLYQQVDWEAEHWVTPVNSLTKVKIKQLSGITVEKQFKAFQTYAVKAKNPLSYDVTLYECTSLYPTYPTNNRDYKKLGTLKKGPASEIRITPSRQNIFLGASNINESDFRHADHRYWPRRGVECEILFEEIDYPSGPGYWADHSVGEATTAADGPWFTGSNQEGNINSTFTVKQPILSKNFWMEINTLDGVSVGPKFEIKPMPGKFYPYTITLWQAANKSDTDPDKAKGRNWTKASETRKKGSNDPIVCSFTGKYVIVGCQSTDAALVDTQWSPRGEDIELMITKIVDTEGSSYYGTYHTASKRGSTDWKNKHWERYNWLVSANGAPLIPTIEYKASVSKSTRNKKYRHSIWQSYTRPNDPPMTNAQETAMLYGADVAKGSAYGSQFKMNNIKGTQGIYLICSTHKFQHATSSKDKTRTLTNWSPKGEYVQLNTLALGADWVPSSGMIGKILSALSALASALLLLLLLLKYVPPTDWLMQFNKSGPKNEVFPSQIPCRGNRSGQKPHGFNWIMDYHNSPKIWNTMLTSHCFFWTAEPKWMNLYADEYASIIARMYGLRHHGYFFDVTNVKANTGYDTSGLGFCNLTQTFSSGIIRNTNAGMKRISIADNKGSGTKTKKWGKKLIIDGKQWRYTDRDNAPTQKIKDAIDEHYVGTAGGTLMQDGTFYDNITVNSIWKRNSRRRFWSVNNVDPTYAHPGDIVVNPENPTGGDYYYAWPRNINTEKSRIWMRSSTTPSMRWFRPAMVRAVDSMMDDTFAIATMNGRRPVEKLRSMGDGPVRQLKTMRIGVNRDRTMAKKTNDGYSSMVASTRSEPMHHNAFDYNWGGDYGSGDEYFMDNIFSSTGFTCHIQDYWKSTGTSHNHAWIMAMEEGDRWPLNEDSGGNDEFYFGLEFDLRAQRQGASMDKDFLHMTFMGMNFETEDGNYDYHDLYPTKETDYLLRFNGAPRTSNEWKGQHLDRGPIKFQMWSTRKIKYTHLITKLYWGFYLYETHGVSKRSYWGHNFSNMRPLSSASDPTGNLILSKKEWDELKAEQAAQNGG